jgi:hypothetical protein
MFNYKALKQKAKEQGSKDFLKKGTKRMREVAGAAKSSVSRSPWIYEGNPSLVDHDIPISDSSSFRSDPSPSEKVTVDLAAADYLRKKEIILSV